MQEVKLQVSDSTQLVVELGGFHNEKGEKTTKGLFDYNMPIKVRYNLGKLSKQALAEAKEFDEANKTLFERLKDKDSNPPIISPEVDGEPNPNHAEFSKEINELLNAEWTISVPDTLTFEDISSIETTENYPTLFKIFEELEKPKK